MAWSIALLIGLILGWGTCMLLDYLFWRKKRICSQAEDELQTIINRLEAEKGSLQSQLAMLTDPAEGKDIEVATQRSRIRESEIEPTVTKTANRANVSAENTESDGSYASTAKLKIDSKDIEADFAEQKPDADSVKPPELTDEARASKVDLTSTSVQDLTEQGAEDTEIANPPSGARRSKDDLAIEAADLADEPAVKDIKSASQHTSLPDQTNNLADSPRERNHQTHESESISEEVEHQRMQSSEATKKPQVLPSQARNNMQTDAVAAGTDSNTITVTAKQESARADNLSCIWGIGKNKQKALNEAGISTFEQLAATSLAELDQLVTKGGDHFKLANQATWLEQAQLAASKQWEELHVLQERLKSKMLQETGGFTLRDNLKEIWGIGKSKHRALYKAGFHIYKQLATTPASYFDKFVDERRDHFNLANQKSWPEQARLAASEQWGSLRVLQDKLKADYQAGLDDLRLIWGIGKKKQRALGRSGIFTFKQLAATPVSDLDELVGKGRSQFNLANQATWPEQAWLAANEQWGELHNLQTKLMIEVIPELATDSRDRRDNLREIWGIGKKKQRALNDIGIFTFERLLATAELELDELFAQGGGDYNLANQLTWSEQAELAVDQQWGTLRALQKKLKAEERSRRDNLRLIWGIGKKKQKALHKIGIYTFEQLAITPVSDFDVLVARSGPDFNLANQPTWPKQARLAASGDWRALRGYQQVLARTYQDPSDRMNRPNQNQTPQ